MDREALFLFDGLSREEIDRCCGVAAWEEQTYSKGQIIYDAATARPALVLVLDGTLRVHNGRVTLKTLSDGDVFGAAALFGSDEPYPTTVEAESLCRVAFIPQETVSVWMATVPRVGENYVRFLSDRIRFLNRRLSTLTAGQTDGKLWRYLLAHQGADGTVHLPDGMVGLASCLDMGRSSLYRSLDSLAAAGRIRRQGKQIVVLKQEE